MTLQAALDWPIQEEQVTRPYQCILDLARGQIVIAVTALPESWRLLLDMCTGKLKAEILLTIDKTRHPNEKKPLHVVQLLASIISVKRPTPQVKRPTPQVASRPPPPPAATPRATAPPASGAAPPLPPPPAPSSGTTSLSPIIDSGGATPPVTSSPPPSTVDSSEESEGGRGGSPTPLAAGGTAAEHTGASLISDIVDCSGGGGGSSTDADAAAAATETAAIVEIKRDNAHASQERPERRAAANSDSSRSGSRGSASPPTAASSPDFRFLYSSNDVEQDVRALNCTSHWLGSLAHLESFTTAPSSAGLRSLLGVRKVMSIKEQLAIVKGKGVDSAARSWLTIKNILSTTRHVRMYRLNLKLDQRVCILLNVRARIIAVYAVFFSTHKPGDLRYVPRRAFSQRIAQL